MQSASIQSRRAAIATALTQCRARTLALFAEGDRAAFCAQPHPDFSPIGWHLGHIGFVESTWLLERAAGLAPSYPTGYRTLYDAAGLPKAERRSLPDLEETQAFLARTRDRVLATLERAPLASQERLWWWLLQHECQHSETIAFIRQLQGGQPAAVGLPASPRLAPDKGDRVAIPAGAFLQGSDTRAQDNERPARRVYLQRYDLDRDPVTCRQYGEFMDAGGYRERQWWSAAGWQWLQANPVDRPLYWSDDPAWDRHPVCGVSYYEAEAYARFAGKRLPTEAEWEKAASWQPATNSQLAFPWGNAFPSARTCNHDGIVGHTTPVGTYPAGASPYGCRDLIGNVWEWTATWFAGYEGFTAFPYWGYSAAYFDGRHRVLKGGSWATRPWALQASWRNWYEPGMRQMLVGFRCAADS